MSLTVINDTMTRRVAASTLTNVRMIGWSISHPKALRATFRYQMLLNLSLTLGRAVVPTLTTVERSDGRLPGPKGGEPQKVSESENNHRFD